MHFFCFVFLVRSKHIVFYFFKNKLKGFVKITLSIEKQCLAHGKCSTNANISLSMKFVFKRNLNGEIFIGCIIVVWCYGNKKEKISSLFLLRP